MRVDNTVPYDVFNSNVEYNLADVDYTKGICLSDEETTNMKDHIVEVGPGAAAFLVHGLSKTNMKEDACQQFAQQCRRDFVAKAGTYHFMDSFAREGRVFFESTMNSFIWHAEGQATAWLDGSCHAV